jgi:hypothetical protein
VPFVGGFFGGALFLHRFDPLGRLAQKRWDKLGFQQVVPLFLRYLCLHHVHFYELLLPVPHFGEAKKDGSSRQPGLMRGSHSESATLS